MLAETGIELDGVEMKGSCATVSWKDGMPKHTAGTLAKLPREWERFDELRASPTLHRPPAPGDGPRQPGQDEGAAPKMQKMREIGEHSLSRDRSRENRTLDRGGETVAACGCPCRRTTENRLVVTERGRRNLLRLAGVRRQAHERGRHLALGEDERLWDCLYERGVVRRSFNAKRFAWIRRMLNGVGLVDVQDPTYVIGERAAKWSPSEKFWELASSLDHKGGEGGQDFTETLRYRPSGVLGTGRSARPGGVTAKETAERRRMEELVEAIVGPATGIWRLEAE